MDAVLAGHDHQYERSYPVYRGRATQSHYRQPRAPVYIVNGAAGNPEILDPTFQPRVAWRAAFRASMTTGFLLMTPSASSLAFRYVQSEGNLVVDSFNITRE